MKVSGYSGKAWQSKHTEKVDPAGTVLQNKLRQVNYGISQEMRNKGQKRSPPTPHTNFSETDSGTGKAGVKAQWKEDIV